MKKKIIIGTILCMALPTCVWGKGVARIIKDPEFSFSTVVGAAAGASVKEKVVSDLVVEINGDKTKDKLLRLENCRAYIGSSEFNTLNGDINLGQSFQTIPDIYELVYKLELLVEDNDGEKNLKNKVIELIKQNLTKPGIVNSLLSAYRLYRADSDNKPVKIKDVDTAKKWLEAEGFSEVLGDMLERVAWDLYIYTNGAYFNMETIFKNLYGDKTKENKIKVRKIRGEQNKDNGENILGVKLRKTEVPTKSEEKKENIIDFRGGLKKTTFGSEGKSGDKKPTDEGRDFRSVLKKREIEENKKPTGETIDLRSGLKTSSKELTIEQVWNRENKDIKLNDGTDIENLINQNSLQIISQEILMASEDKLDMPTVRKLLLYYTENKQYKKGYIEDMLKAITADLLEEEEKNKLQQKIENWAKQTMIGGGAQSNFRNKILAELGGVPNIGKDFSDLLKSNSADIHKFINDIISIYMRMRFRELLTRNEGTDVWVYNERSSKKKSEFFVFGDSVGDDNIMNDYYLFLNETPDDLQQRVKNMSVGEYKLFNPTEEWPNFKKLDDAIDNYFKRESKKENNVALFVKRIIYCGILNRLKISPANTDGKAALAFIHCYFDANKKLKKELVANITNIITDIAQQLEKFTEETRGKTQFYKLFKIKDILVQVIKSSFGKDAECSIYDSEAVKNSLKNYSNLEKIYNNNFPKYKEEILENNLNMFESSDTERFCNEVKLEYIPESKFFYVTRKTGYSGDLVKDIESYSWWIMFFYEGHVYCSLWDLVSREDGFYKALESAYEISQAKKNNVPFSKTVVNAFNGWEAYYYFIKAMKEGESKEKQAAIEQYKNLSRVALNYNKFKTVKEYFIFDKEKDYYDFIGTVQNIVEKNDVGAETKKEYDEFCSRVFEKFIEIITQFPQWGIVKPETAFNLDILRKYFYIWKNGDFKRRLKEGTYEECAFELANIILYKKNKTDDNTISEAYKNDLLKCITKSDTTISGFVEKIVDRVFDDFGIEITTKIVNESEVSNKPEYDAAKEELRMWCKNVVQDILGKYAKYLKKLFDFVDVAGVNTIYTNAKGLRNDMARSNELMYIALHYSEDEFIAKLVGVIKEYYKPDEIKTNKSNILIGKIKAIDSMGILKDSVLKEFKTTLSSKIAIQVEKDDNKKS